MKMLLAAVVLVGLSACGNEAKPGAAPSGTAKSDTKPAATGAATASAAPKKEDSGW